MPSEAECRERERAAWDACYKWVRGEGFTYWHPQDRDTRVERDRRYPLLPSPKSRLWECVAVPGHLACGVLPQETPIYTHDGGHYHFASGYEHPVVALEEVRDV